MTFAFIFFHSSLKMTYNLNHCLWLNFSKLGIISSHSLPSIGVWTSVVVFFLFFLMGWGNTFLANVCTNPESLPQNASCLKNSLSWGGDTVLLPQNFLHRQLFPNALSICYMEVGVIGQCPCRRSPPPPHLISYVPTLPIPHPTSSTNLDLVRMAVWTASSSSISSLYLFSRNVLPLTWFLPIAVAFQGKYAPDGSHWNKYGLASSSSQPATRRDTPNGRTPLKHRNTWNTI